MSAQQAWRKAAPAMSLRSWRNSELAQVAALVEDAWQAWAREWDVPLDGAAAVVCRPAEERPAAPHAWHPLGCRGDARAWVVWSGDEASRLAASWFDDDDVASPVVADLVYACRKDAHQCFARALHLASSDTGALPAHEIFSRWSGAVTVSLRWGGLLLLESGVVDGLVARVPRPAALSLVGIGSALAGTELSLRVDLQGCELPLGALRSLRAGDVLRLPHRVDAPATVLDARGQAVFRGWLARSRGRRAVELAALGAQ